MVASLRSTGGNDAVMRFVEELAAQGVPGPRGKVTVSYTDHDRGIVTTLQSAFCQDETGGVLSRWR